MLTLRASLKHDAKNIIIYKTSSWFIYPTLHMHNQHFAMWLEYDLLKYLSLPVTSLEQGEKWIILLSTVK